MGRRRQRDAPLRHVGKRRPSGAGDGRSGVLGHELVSGTELRRRLEADTVAMIADAQNDVD
jgi:hypothetical protein